MLMLTVFFMPSGIKAQGPCEASVPKYTVDLSYSPSAIWQSTNTARQGTCCGYNTPNNIQCIYFTFTLNPNTAGIQFDLAGGADPSGSLYYQVANVSPGGTLVCGSPTVAGGAVKCISGVGPHELVLCKPGGNPNIYKITAVSKPLFPKDDTTRVGCKKKLITHGIFNTTVIWSAISGSNAAQNAFYNTFLDSTNVASPTFSAPVGTYSNITSPFFVDYQVCGLPIASAPADLLPLCVIPFGYGYTLL